MRSNGFKCAAALLLGVFTTSVMAGSWSWEWTRPFQSPSRQINTLVITGNYKRPLAIAQLIRAENRQPYLLVPAQESGEKDVFFCPVNEKTPALKVKAADISRFVRLMNPGRVIILGDTRYVPESYVPELEGQIPVVRIDCDDWARNASTLNGMLNLNNLERDYKEIGPKLERNVLYKPLPSKPAPEVQPEPEKAPEVPAVPEKTPEVKPEPAPVPADNTPVTGKVTPAAEVK